MKNRKSQTSPLRVLAGEMGIPIFARFVRHCAFCGIEVAHHITPGKIHISAFPSEIRKLFSGISLITEILLD